MTLKFLTPNYNKVFITSFIVLLAVTSQLRAQVSELHDLQGFNSIKFSNQFKSIIKDEHFNVLSLSQFNGDVADVNSLTDNSNLCHWYFATHPSTSLRTYCINAQNVVPLTVAVGAGCTGTLTGYQWYRNTNNSTSGGTLITGATSASYTPSSSDQGDFYYYCIATISSGPITSNVSGRHSFNANTAGVLSGTQSICGVGAMTTFSSTVSGGTWSSSNTSIATVDNMGMVEAKGSGTATITYTVAGSSCNTNTRTVTVEPAPNAPVGTSGSRTGNGTINLSATVGNGETVDWYAAASGGSALATGSTSFTTPSISQTTIYYAEARNTTSGCVSATRTPVTATVQGGFNCPSIDNRNNGNGQSSSCAGVSGTPTASDVVNTQYSTVPSTAKTGDITFNFSTNPTVVPAITKVWINDGLSTAEVGPPSVVTTQGQSYLVKYCFYNTNLPNAGTYTLEFTDPQTSQVLGRCTFTGNSNTSTTEPTLSNSPAPTLSNFADITKYVGDAAFTITAPTSNSNGSFSYTSSNTSVATVSGGTITILADGTSTITATQAATGSYASGSIAATLTVLPRPTITLSGTLNTFSSCVGAPSNAQTFSVSGANLIADVSLASVTGFEYSLDGSTYSPSLILQRSGSTLSSTTIYVRLSSTATGSPSGSINITSTNAVQQSLAVNGSIVVTPTAPTGTSGSRIGTGTVNLSATVANGNTVDWYAAATGGSALLSGSLTYTTPSISQTTTYYAQTRNIAAGCLSSSRTAINATILVAPVITSFSPTTAGNGETVVITGTGFIGVTVVKFGNVDATSFTVNSNTQITAVVGSARSGDVYVQNSAGNDTEPGFIYKIVQYNFENNAQDATAANLHGTVSGTVAYNNGVEGKAVCFDRSSNNWIVLPNNLIRNQTDFTISLRFKTTSKGVMMGYQNAVVNSTSTNSYIPILVVQTDGKLRATLWTTANRDMSVVSSSVVNDGNWHKVDMSVTPNSINIYIDGTLAGSTNSGTVAHLDMQWNQLGRGRTDAARESSGGDLTGWQGFTGCIDNFMILDKGQSLASINQATQLPAATITSFTPTVAKSGELITINGTNLSGATTVQIGGVNARVFNVVSANQITALVGKDATLDQNVSVTTAAGTAQLNGFTFNCSSNAISFDGVDDFIQIASALPFLSSDNFTIEAWVNPRVINSNYQGFFGLQESSTRTPSMWVGPNGSLHTDAYNSTTRYDMLVDNFFSANKWTHVAWVKNGSTFIIYKNGVQIATRQAASSLNMPGQSFWIGKVDNFLNGSIDEVRIWNVARTAQQISSNLGNELVGNETGLKAYYNFNQGTPGASNSTQATLYNLTETSNLNGTITSSSLSGATSNYVLGFWPLIITQPSATSSVCMNASSGNTLSVTAVGNQLTYQWFSNTTNSNTGGTAINGANSASFNAPTSSTGTYYYYVVVSSGCNAGTDVSNVSTVTVTALPAISYGTNPLRFERTKAITSVTPVSTGAAANNYTISPALPQGLAINVANGVISGTPSVVSAAATYTVTARTAAGCTSTASFSLEVFNAVAPSALSYTPNSQTVRQNTAITNMVPTAYGDPVESYTISPALPTGLSINATTGIIGGTLSTAQTGSVTYTITASNTGGNTTATATLIYNTAPTDITVTPAAVNENAASGATVGTLTATDADAGDTHTYTLVPGTGSTDNASFSINGNSLRTAAVFDFETKSSYSIRVKVADAGGLSFEKAFTISVNNVNETPTNIALSATAVNENAASGTTVGTLSATDVDTGDTFTYTLVPGTGSTDNASFSINGNSLRTAAVFDFETKSSYSIRVKVTDAGGLSFEKTFTINVNDLDNEDTDGDGILDSVEKGSDPSNPRDTDGDGTPDFKDTDADNDGVPDSVEVADGTDPLDKTKYKDTDGDMVPDHVEGLDGTSATDAKRNYKDSDGDGVPDYVEILDGTDPNNAASFKDTDSGGVPDYVETKLFPAYGLVATDGSVRADDNQDTDGDGVSDYRELLAGTNANEAPANLSYTPNRQIAEQGKAITAMNPTVTRRVISYAISPALPTGLTLNTTTGVISGTRSQALTGAVTYTITATNRGGSTTSTITLTHNTTPTDIATSKANIYEGNNVGDVIGLLSTTDVDNPETHTYTLVALGTNTYDNKNFKISGNQLLADTTFNFDFKNAYVVRIRSTDSQGLFTEKIFNISISKRPVIYGTSSEAYIQSTYTGTNNITTKPIISKGYSSQLSIFGSDIRSVSWSPGTGLSSTTSLTPVFKHGSTVTYTVTITNTFGSVVVLPFTVEVRDDYFIKPTNIITTRMDGINDYFVVENIATYPDNEVTIYDRNGKILTKINNYNNRWDGKVNGKLLSTDTYYYLIRFTSNPKAVFKGFITIINN